jgi:hypothetical protein
METPAMARIAGQEIEHRDGGRVGASQPGHPGRQHHQQAEDPDDGGTVEGPGQAAGTPDPPDPEAYDSGAPPWRLK